MLTIHIYAINIEIAVGACASTISIIGKGNSHCFVNPVPKFPQNETVSHLAALCSTTTSCAVVTCLPSMDRTNCAFPFQASSDRLSVN